MRPSGTSCKKCNASLPPGARFCAGCGTAVGSADPSRTSQPKEIIDGRYLVLQTLSQSGTGTTYLVRDMKGDATRVLKLATATDDASAARVAREAGTVGVVRHANLAGVIGSSRIPAGNPYLVLEYVPGPDLGRILADGPLSRGDALSVALGLADALQALHARQLLHRDVKPGNIVIPEEAGAFQFKRAALVDFGAFGELTRRRSGEQHTQTGQIVGTPVYMSPEQLSGNSQSAATDVYGLGLVLYEMLIGRRPYAGEAGSIMEIMFRRLASEIEFPSDVSLTEPLKELLRGMLRRNPQERVTMLQVLSVLRREAGVARPSLDPVSPGSAVPAPPAGELSPRPAVAGPERPIAARPSAARTGLGAAIGFIAVATLLVIVSSTRGYPSTAGSPSLSGLLAGIAMVTGGVGLALLVRQVAAARRPALQVQAGQVLFGAQSRASLTVTLALQVDQLVERCREMGEAYWGQTVALMLKEYEEAKEGKDRREALMNVATLLEKVTARLSPWFVRYEKLLAVVSTSVGILGGGWKIVSEVISLTKS